MTERPDMDEVLMEMASAMSRRATCSRRKVGALIALEGRPLASGYNGAVSGAEHCEHPVRHDPQSCEKVVMGPVWGCTCDFETPCEVSVHAEQNAIAFAARHGVATEGTTLYLTLEPCLPCAKLVVNAGIVRVVFQRRYRSSTGVKLLIDSGVQVEGPTSTIGSIRIPRRSTPKE